MAHRVEVDLVFGFLGIGGRGNFSPVAAAVVGAMQLDAEMTVVERSVNPVLFGFDE